MGGTEQRKTSAVGIAMTIVGAIAFLAMLYIIGLWS